MAFFGLQWVPVKENVIKPSEANEFELATLVKTIRLTGYGNSKAEYSLLYEEYMQKSSQLTEAQKNIKLRNSNLQKNFANLSPEDIQTIENIVSGLQANDAKTFEYFESLPVNQKQSVQEYHQYLDATNEISNLETRLNVIGESLKLVEQTARLWEFEIQTAALREAKLAEIQKELNARQVELFKLIARRAREHQKLLTNKRASTDYKPKRNTIDKQYVVANQDVESVLKVIDRVAKKYSAPLTVTKNLSRSNIKKYDQVNSKPFDFF